MDTDPLRSPTPPRQPLPFLRWVWRLGRDVFDEYSEDGVGDLAAAITFWTILSIPAAALALVSTLSSLERFGGPSLAEDVEAQVQELIRETLVDSEALSDAVSELFAGRSTGVAVAATLVAFFTLSRAFAGLIRALDIAYEVEEGRPFWYVRLIAIGLGIATIVIVTATAVFVAILPSLPLGPFVSTLALLVALLVLVGWSATLFHIGPNHRTPWKYDLPGAIFTTIGWVVTSQLYALYVRVSSEFNEVQSSVGAVLLALTLLYLLSVVLVLGAEVNDVIARRSGVVEAVAPVQERARRLRERLLDDEDDEEEEGDGEDRDG